MSDLEVARIAGEVVGVVAVFFGGVWWLTREIYKVLKATQAVDARLDTLNGSVARHDKALQTHEKQLAFLEGKEAARAELAKAAQAAATIVTTSAERREPT